MPDNRTANRPPAAGKAWSIGKNLEKRDPPSASRDRLRSCITQCWARQGESLPPPGLLSTAAGASTAAPADQSDPAPEGRGAREGTSRWQREEADEGWRQGRTRNWRSPLSSPIPVPMMEAGMMRCMIA